VFLDVSHHCDFGDLLEILLFDSIKELKVS
jgi:hypothetical protein